MKECKCVEVKHYKDVGRAIEEWQKNGWSLHTYQIGGLAIQHYLLFEREENS